MKKIIITGAGSAQANGVINCLRMANGGEQIIGFGSDPIDLVMCDADVRYLIPHSQHPDYKAKLLATLAALKPDMIHFQHDLELWTALKFRDEIEATGVRMLVPDFETIDTCVHKFKSWEKFKSHGLVVPENILVNTPQDLKAALESLGNDDGTIWLRSTEIGGGGKGAFPTNDLNEATEWIERYDGWGHFSAAELLTNQTVTWLSIWKDGDLVVSQSRRRKGWAHSSLSPSGVTGVTKIGETCSDPEVEEIGTNAVQAVSKTPHGIYGVDMTYDKNGVPNPTEINISRFFTTIQFFAEAGLNMPAILKDIVLYNRLPPKEARMRNPLPDGLLWLRAMDRAPLLTTATEIRALLNEVP